MADPLFAPRTSRRHAWIVAGIGAVVVALIVGAQLAANMLYDSAHDDFASRALQLTEKQDLLKDTRDSASESTDAATTILAADTGALIGADTRTQLGTHLEAAKSSLDAANDTAGESVARIEPKPLWPWALFSSSQKLQADAAAAHELAKLATTNNEALASADVALREQTSAALTTAASAAPTIEQENVWARTGDVIALREASAAVARSAATITSTSGSDFSALEAAVISIRASAQDELSQKSGWLYDTRLEIEAYARSISGGVLLDFDWSPLVNGYGDGGSAGGTATWNSESGGFSTITLSDSVAEMWPDDVARALVTHEVGHSIASKCWEMFEWSDQQANEAWATAWALSWGETADGNGVALYGYPPQSLIDTAATCR